MKPILFNTEMVQAILDGKKSVTRRPVKPQPDIDGLEFDLRFNIWMDTNEREYKAPAKKCDILWVRETWAKIEGEYVYRADDEIPEGWHLTAWKPSIHMPREASRIFLRVTDVRVERLKEIKFRDIRQEGVNWWEEACEKWINVWNSTIKPADLPTYGWEANPWVWVISFERITKEEAENKRR